MPEHRDYQQAIDGELIRIHFSYSSTTGLVFILLSWVVTLVVWDAAPRLGLMLWVGAVHLGTLGRFRFGRNFVRRNPGDREMAPWRLGIVVMSAYHGFLWGALAPLLMASGDQLGLIIAVTILFGLGATAMVVASAYLPSLFLFLLPSLGVLIISLGLQGGTLAWTVMLVALAALSTYIVHGLRVHRFLVESLRLRFENLGLRLAEEERSRQLEVALRHMNQGMAMADADGRLRLWNQRFLDLLGLSEYTPGGSVDQLLKRFAPELENGPRAVAEYVRSDGQVVELAQGTTPTGGRVLTLTDITDHKLKEHSLEVARLSAERANRAKTRFLSAASHDLRQPIHALGLFFHNLAARVRNPETEPLIDSVEETIGLIDEMLSALLDISKLDAGVVQPNLGAVEMDMLFKQLAAEFSPIAQERGMRMRIRPCNRWVRSDAAMLLRILGNLLSNALKFSGYGQVMLAARVRGGKLRCMVLDTGPGIPPESQDEIFYEFHQLDNPQRDRRQGLGLGLAIVRRLAELLDHPLHLVSTPGRGSCFSVDLPLVAAPQVAAAEASVAMPAPGQELSGLRVLLLDDDEVVQTAMRNLLLGWGCEVEVVESLSAAEALLEAGSKPELLVVDYCLPDGRNGAEAIERLRSRLGYAKLPALIVTGDTAPERLAEAEALGYPLLHKPTQPARLRSMLRHLVAQQGPASYEHAQ